MKSGSKRISPHTIYKNKDRVRLPGVTTITDAQLGWNKRILINWANNLGLEGIDSSKYTDETAQIGKLAHKLILNDFLKQPTDTSIFSQYEINNANISFNKYKLWESTHTVKPIIIEKPLISESHQFGGTPDFYGEVDNLLTLMDFKTGGGLYPEHYIQVAGGYAILLNEHSYKIDQILLLNIPCNELNPFQKHYFPKNKWDYCQSIFLNCLNNHQLQKLLNKKEV